MNEQEIIRATTRALDQGTRELDTATLAALASARSRAVRGSPQLAGHGLLSHGQRHPWLGLAMAAVLLLVGWFLYQAQRPVDTGEADILLLTDDLPPSAYAEQDFSRWLKSQGN